LTSKRNKELKTSVTPIVFNKPNINININIHPDNYGDPSPLTDNREEWFLNLSEKSIPKEITLLLQLGDRFNLPLINQKFALFEYIKSIENSLEKIKKDDRIFHRNKLVTFLEDLNKPFGFDNVDKLLVEWFKITKKFMYTNRDILFTRADKGNTTVALDKFEYEDKINNMLNDKETYRLIDKDPINSITDNLRKMLTHWKNREFIDKITYNSLFVSDGVLPRAYGLPKIHKSGYPYRIIISTINSPLHKLALFSTQNY